MSLENPKITVVGAGAIGGLFGALLADGGLDVTLVDTWPEHIAAIAANGIRVVGEGGDRSIPIRATTLASDVKDADVVIFQCKSFSNTTAAESALHLFTSNPETVAVTFQNGLGNEETLGKIVGPDRLVSGLTAQAGLVEAAGVVRNFGELPTTVGEPAGGQSERAMTIAKTFTRCGLPTTATPNIKKEKWRKLLGNVGLGAISALTDMRSYEIMALPELKETVLRLVDEATLVAEAEGVTLDTNEARSVLMQISATKSGGTGASKSSMREDIIQRRRTEIDTIHGAVARLARRHNIPTPTLDALVALVKGLEHQTLSKGE
ncbi:MAG: ketopantoate reductase family protein [Hyphomicrobiaceae bacterium]